MTKYYTYRSDAEANVQPGQTVDFTKGKGYYIVGTPTQTSSSKSPASGGSATSSKGATSSSGSAKPVASTGSASGGSKTTAGNLSPTAATVQPVAASTASTTTSATPTGIVYYTSPFEITLKPDETIAYTPGKGYYVVTQKTSATQKTPVTPPPSKAIVARIAIKPAASPPQNKTATKPSAAKATATGTVTRAQTVLSSEKASAAPINAKTAAAKTHTATTTSSTDKTVYHESAAEIKLAKDEQIAYAAGHGYYTVKTAEKPAQKPEVEYNFRLPASSKQPTVQDIKRRAIRPKALPGNDADKLGGGQFAGAASIPRISSGLPLGALKGAASPSSALTHKHPTLTARVPPRGGEIPHPLFIETSHSNSEIYKAHTVQDWMMQTDELAPGQPARHPVVGPAVVVRTTPQQIKAISEEFSLTDLLKEAGNTIVKNTKIGKQGTALLEVTNAVKKALVDNNRRPLIDLGVDHLKDMIADQIKEKGEEALSAFAIKGLKALGVPHPEAVVSEIEDALDEVEAPLLLAAQLYIMSLEVAAANRFVRAGGPGHVWYEHRHPSEKNKTFLMAIFVGVGPEGALQASVGTGVQIRIARTKSAVARGDVAPVAAGAAISTGEAGFAGIASTSSTSSQTPAAAQAATRSSVTTRSLPLVTPYGRAFFYWNTP